MPAKKFICRHCSATIEWSPSVGAYVSAGTLGDVWCNWWDRDSHHVPMGSGQPSRSDRGDVMGEPYWIELRGYEMRLRRRARHWFRRYWEPVRPMRSVSQHITMTGSLYEPGVAVNDAHIEWPPYDAPVLWDALEVSDEHHQFLYAGVVNANITLPGEYFTIAAGDIVQKLESA